MRGTDRNTLVDKRANTGLPRDQDKRDLATAYADVGLAYEPV